MRIFIPSIKFKSRFTYILYLKKKKLKNILQICHHDQKSVGEK